MISVVCVFNNLEVLNNYLLPSLKRQTAEFELILIDNRSGKYPSIALALNEGGNQAKGDYVMFIHQDVSLMSSDWLANAEKIVETLERFAIAGVAGKKNEKGVISNITHGSPPISAGKIQLQKPEIVQTLDECLVIIPRSLFSELPFDAEACDNWHLYAVDYCLSVQKAGLNAYVIPIRVYHASSHKPKRKTEILLSGDPLYPGYFSTLRKLVKKHGQTVNIIYTTCGDWNTKTPLAFQKGILCIKYLLTVL